MPRITLALPAALLMLLTLAACEYDGNADAGTTADNAQARTIEMIATDFAFQPSQLTVQPGQPLAVRLVNRGQAPHNIEFELPSGEVEFEQPVQPGETRTLRFTAPTQSGSYTYYCPVGNHEQRGMVGTLVVRR